MCQTRAIEVQHKQHKCNTGATQAGHECGEKKLWFCEWKGEWNWLPYNQLIKTYILWIIRQGGANRLRSKACRGIFRFLSSICDGIIWKKTFALTIFEKSSTLEAWNNSKYELGSVYVRVLNITRFWICSYYEYALSSTYGRLLNIPGF